MERNKMRKYLLLMMLGFLILTKCVFGKVVLTEVISMGTTSAIYQGTSTIKTATYTVGETTKLIKNFEFSSALITFRGTNTAQIRWLSDDSIPTDSSHDIEAFVLNNYLDIIHFKAVLINNAETDVGTLTISYSASNKDNN